MHEELFADGVGEITVTGHTVRIDIVSLSPVERDANNNPAARFRQRIIMPVDGFANAVDLMRKVLSGLVEADLVTRAPGSTPAVTPASITLPDDAPAATMNPASGSANASPNFSFG